MHVDRHCKNACHSCMACGLHHAYALCDTRLQMKMMNCMQANPLEARATLPAMRLTSKRWRDIVDDSIRVSLWAICALQLPAITICISPAGSTDSTCCNDTRQLHCNAVAETGWIPSNIHIDRHVEVWRPGR